MNFAYNTTFVIDPRRRAEFVNWLTKDALPRLLADGSGAKLPRVSEVLEAGGEKPGPDHGHSVSLYVEFDDEATARRWHDGVLAAELSLFHSQFGPQALFFITMLGVVDL